MATSTGVDALLLLVVLALVALAVLGAQLQLALQPVRPALPVVDRAPDGLGRLVPFGGQVDVEARHGLAALDLWLRTRRSRP